MLQKNGRGRHVGEGGSGTAWPVKKPRVALYEPWGGRYRRGLDPVDLRAVPLPIPALRRIRTSKSGACATLRRHRLRRDRAPGRSWTACSAARSRASMPAESARRARGAARFRHQGGTLVTLGNATLFAIEQFNLAVTNVVAGSPKSVLLLRVDSPGGGQGGQPSRWWRGCPRSRGDVRAQSRVRDEAGLPRQDARELRQGPQSAAQRLPARSGLIQGKAAAIDANYGRGTSSCWASGRSGAEAHGTYKFLFNSPVLQPSMAPDTRAPGRRRSGRGGGGGDSASTPGRREAESIKSRDSRNCWMNRAFFTARGPTAAEEGNARNRAGYVPARPSPLSTICGPRWRTRPLRETTPLVLGAS